MKTVWWTLSHSVSSFVWYFALYLRRCVIMEESNQVLHRFKVNDCNLIADIFNSMASGAFNAFVDFIVTYV